MHIETEATQHLQRAAGAARAASHVLARTPDAERNAALRAMAASLRSHARDILAANAADLAACTGTAAFRDRLALTEARVDAMANGPGGHRAAARSARPHAGRLDAAERPAHPAHRHADRRDRHDLREPPQCRRRCRRHLPEVGQRGDPARRLGKRAQRRGDQRRAGRRAARRRIAGSLRADRAQRRPRLCRRDAGRGRPARPDRAARRKVAGRARAARGARARARACRRALPHLRPRVRRSRRWPGASWPTPRCAAPASAAPPRRC